MQNQNRQANGRPMGPRNRRGNYRTYQFEHRQQEQTTADFSHRRTPHANQSAFSSHHSPSALSDSMMLERESEPASVHNHAPNWRMEKLSQEILDHWEKVRPSKDVLKTRDDVFNRVKQLIEGSWKGLRVEMFGSTATKLFLPHSDIDIVVIDEMKRGKVDEWFDDAMVVFKNSNEYSGLQFIKSAISLIKCRDSQSNIEIDICFETEQGSKCVYYVKEVLEKYPIFEPLIFFLKDFLKRHSLNSVFRGHISSYSTFLMLLNFLKKHVQNAHTLRPENSGETLGKLLFSFFEFYAEEFDFRQSRIFVSEQQYTDNATMATVEITDPLDPTKNVAKGSYNFVSVLLAFQRAYQCIDWADKTGYEKSLVDILIPPTIEKSNSSSENNAYEWYFK